MVKCHRWSHSVEEDQWDAAFGSIGHVEDVEGCARTNSGLRRPDGGRRRCMNVGYALYAVRDTQPPTRCSPL